MSNASSSQKLREGTLSTGSIVFMVVAAAAPLTVIAGTVPLGLSMGNGAGYPAMYAISAILLGVFSIGLVTMSKFVKDPGGFFSFVEATFGRRVGIGTAYVALAAYTVIQLAVYGYLGQALSTLLDPVVHIPWFIMTLVNIAIIGFLGYRNIELSSKALGVLLIAEIAIVVLIDFFVVKDGGNNGLDMVPFMPRTITSGSFGIGLTLALAGFIGFESTTVFHSEARDPDRTIPRATYLAVAIIGIFYALSSWAIVEGVGSQNAVQAATDDPEGLVGAVATRYVGSWSGPVVQVLLLTSLFACVLSFHNVLSRYQFAISHKRGLPRGLRHVHDKFGSPHVSSVVQTVTAAVLVIGCALAQLDPILQVFTWFSGAASFMIIVLMLATSICVVLFFRHGTFENVNAWNSKIAPVIAAIGLTISLYIVGSNLTVLTGNFFVSGAVIATVPVLFIAGLLFATFIPEKASATPAPKVEPAISHAAL